HFSGKKGFFYPIMCLGFIIYFRILNSCPGLLVLP
ncbi:MAG: hypothetical protein ACJATA_000801, partial [Sphingobacteriales bacterium]